MTRSPTILSPRLLFLSLAATTTIPAAVVVAFSAPGYSNSLNTQPPPPSNNGASYPSSSARPRPTEFSSSPVLSRPPRSGGQRRPPTEEEEETYDGGSYLAPHKFGRSSASSSSSRLHHATLSDFAVNRLLPMGPRDNADIGDPHDAIQDWVAIGDDYDEDEKITAGAWWCASGGWMSPQPRSSTKVFFVLQGQGCVTDADGLPHEFGPGDVVTLPKGWSGRWDVLEDVHHIWFCHRHLHMEQPPQPPQPPQRQRRGNNAFATAVVRATCTPFEKLMAPQYLNPMAGGASSRLLYHAGPTTVGCVVCAPGSSTKICHDAAECFHILEGVLFLTQENDGGGSVGGGANNRNGQESSQRCVAGDTVILPPGWSGHHDVVEKTTMLWINMEEENDHGE